MQRVPPPYPPSNPTKRMRPHPSPVHKPHQQAHGPQRRGVAVLPSPSPWSMTGAADQKQRTDLPDKTPSFNGHGHSHGHINRHNHSHSGRGRGRGSATEAPYITAATQHDGLSDFHPGMRPRVSPQRDIRGYRAGAGVDSTSTPQGQGRGTAVADVLPLLPYCTADLPLGEEQVIALSDVVGSLRELVVVGLCAREDEGERRRLEGAVGERAAGGIVDFWADEYAV